MIELYAHNSPNSQKVAIMLEEVGLPYKVHDVRIENGAQFEPEFVKLSPNAKVPVIVDNDTGQVVFESCAILLYLADKTGKLFYPYGTPQYWEALEWLFFQAACVGPFFGQRAHFVWFAPERVPYGLKRYTKESERLYGVIDNRLAERKYFMGDDYTIVDIAHYAWVYTHKVMGFSFAGFDNMKAWYERIDARPAAQKGIYVPKKIMDFDLENGGHHLTAEEMAA